ncbi:MAG TPA: ROK family protein [Bryobacteraceae bacterium]|nr:ROK family protein [Bryobacteraceae bacterium]
MFGAIEAGGTKFVCGIGTGPSDLETTQFPTTTSPEATVQQAVEFFRARGAGKLQAVGIASFGPIDPHPDSPTFGYITSTPKEGWRDFDLAGSVGRALHVPVGFDTDVNGAALGESRWGAAQGVADFLYLTVGTGIGGGAMVHGRILHGLLHPEMGHIRIPHNCSQDPYPGGCPFHGDCLEGLASGPAMEARWGVRAQELPIEHPAWRLEAHYLALGLANWVCTLSPRRIVMGGGVMQQAHLFPLIRAELLRILNDYIQAPEITARPDSFVVPPQLGSHAGVLGALALGQAAIARG